MPKHLKILELLSLVAEEVDVSQQRSNARLAAAVVYKNEIVAIGVNQKKSHPFQAKFGKNGHAIFLHAEISAIKNALQHIDEKELSKSTLYVCRVKYVSPRKGSFTWGLAKPCVGCQRAIVTFDIKSVIYSEEGRGAYTFL